MIKERITSIFQLKTLKSHYSSGLIFLEGCYYAKGKCLGLSLMKSQAQGGLMYEWRYLNWLVLKLNYCNTITLNSQKNLQHPTSLAMLTLRL